MGLFKTPAERSAVHERAALKKAAARERKNQQRFERSPAGRASAASARGDRLFQIVLTVDDECAKHVETVEDAGWTLDNVGYVHEPTVISSTTNGQLSGFDYSGKLLGVYMFRRS